MKKHKMVRFSSRDLKKKRQAAESRTDWGRVKSMKEKEIDFSDSPETTPEIFARSLMQKGLKLPSRKTQLTLRIDGDVLSWFKEQGRGYQTRMNALLRAYKNAHGMGR